MLTRQITPEAILNLAEALDALGDSLSRDSSRGGEIDTYRFLDGLLATSTTFRREAARLGAPVYPALVVDIPEAPLAPVIPFERNPRPRGPE